MRLLSIVVVCLVVLPGAARAQGGDTQKNEVVEQFIASEAKRLGGDEFPEARSIKRTGEAGAGLIAIVALYTIEGVGGSNNYTQYRVAFINAGKGVRPTKPVSAGGKLYRAVELEAVDAHQIVLKTTRYADKDPACCPTMAGSTSYRLAGGKLVEARRRER